MRYARQTLVSTERSKGEIERILTRYGARSFAYGWEGDLAIIMFEAHGRRIKFRLGLPSKEKFASTPKGRRRRNPEDQQRAWEQACRQAWRSLALIIKAKLEWAETNVELFEDEFLAYMVLPSGQTAGQWLRPQIAEVYEHKRMPAMLLGIGETGKERR